MRYVFLLACLMAWIPPAGAAEPTCELTPKLTALHYPGVKMIPTTNHLLKPTGKSIEASGQRLILMGQLRDKHCMPIANATIELWQVDPYGKWILATPADIATPNPAFAGAGRTYTDSDGRFSFITAFPGTIKDRAPHLNLRVDAASFPSFSTVLYFANDNRNPTDEVLKKISKEARDRVMVNMQPLSAEPGDGHYGMIEIVLPGKVPYRRY